MYTLGKRQDQEEQTFAEDSVLPVMLKKQTKEIPLEKAVLISTLAHPLVIGLIWLLIKGLILLLAILGITLPIFDKPQPKMRDIEFVLVNKPEQTPINPNTKFRAEKNTRAGGKHDPNKPISEPEPRASRSLPKQPSSPATPRKAVQQTPSRPKPVQPQRPAPPRPTPNSGAARPKIEPPKGFAIPVPKTNAPKAVSPNTGGPVTSGPIGSSSHSSSPAPMMSHGGSSSSGRNSSASGYSMGGGNAGNPGPGNPSGAPGIDAIKEPDFGPYMSELQRRIKRNWTPPKGEESKRVVLLFKVSRDGRLLSLRVLKSSGVSEADKAALSAVELTAPFRPLPPEYRGSDIDIQFTFDYNVYGVKRR